MPQTLMMLNSLTYCWETSPSWILTCCSSEEILIVFLTRSGIGRILVIWLNLLCVKHSDFMKQNGLIDPWRFHDPSIKKCSFFSQVHHSYSKIDYFFIDSTLNSCVNSSDYLGIVISDHSPLLLDIRLSTYEHSPPTLEI